MASRHARSGRGASAMAARRRPLHHRADAGEPLASSVRTPPFAPPRNLAQLTDRPAPSGRRVSELGSAASAASTALRCSRSARSRSAEDARVTLASARMEVCARTARAREPGTSTYQSLDGIMEDPARGPQLSALARTQRPSDPRETSVNASCVRARVSRRGAVEDAGSKALRGRSGLTGVPGRGHRGLTSARWLCRP
jgi:hypothetical protein